MKKGIIKLISCMIMVSLMLTVVSGCGGKSKYDPNNFIADTNNPMIVKEKVTIKMFAPRHGLHVQNFNDMVLFKEMEKRTNIHIEWMYGDVDNYENARTTAWASNSKPDAFFLWNKVDEQIKYSKNGSVIPLDDLINSYAPNYKALLDGNPEIRKSAQLLDGKMYSTVIINDVPRDQTFKQYINKEFLDALGLDMPQTIEQYRDVLRAFKAEDSTIIPLSSVALKQTRNFVMSAFGYVSTGIEVDGDTVKYVPTTDNYRAYLNFMRSLYEERLLDNKVFEMVKEQDLAAKGSKVASFDHSAPYLVVGTANDHKYVAIPPLTSAINDKKMWLSFNETYAPTGLVIYKGSKYSKEIIRWIDALYAMDTRELQAFGKEGENWSWDNTEKNTFTFNVPQGQNSEQYRGSITPGVGLGPIAYWDKNFVLKENNEFTNRINQNVENAGYMDYLKVPYPSAKFTTEENKAMAILSTDLTNYVSQFEQEVITGKTVLTDANWAKHISNLNKIGIVEYVKIHQTAYDRYLELNK